MTTLAEIQGQRLPSSFDGIPFNVAKSRRFGANETITDFVIGRGSRRRIIGPGETGWQITATIVDDRLAAAVQTLDERLKLLESTSGTGVLVHPFDGVRLVVPDTWSFSYTGEKLDHAVFEATFIGAELPPVPESAGVVPQTADAVVVTMAELARALADEPDPLAQLEVMRELLQLPDALQGADYTQAATLRLGVRADIEATRVPRIIQQLGSTARAAATGELTTSARDQLRILVWLEASRSNSLGLVSMRESWSMYLGAQGVDAFGQVVINDGGLLLNLPGDLDRLARLNRTAVQTMRIGAQGARL